LDKRRKCGANEGIYFIAIFPLILLSSEIPSILKFSEKLITTLNLRQLNAIIKADNPF